MFYNYTSIKILLTISEPHQKINKAKPILRLKTIINF